MVDLRRCSFLLGLVAFVAGCRHESADAGPTDGRRTDAVKDKRASRDSMPSKPSRMENPTHGFSEHGARSTHGKN